MSTAMRRLYEILENPGPNIKVRRLPTAGEAGGSSDPVPFPVRPQANPKPAPIAQETPRAPAPELKKPSPPPQSVAAGPTRPPSLVQRAASMLAGPTVPPSNLQPSAAKPTAGARTGDGEIRVKGPSNSDKANAAQMANIERDMLSSRRSTRPWCQRISSTSQAPA